MEEYYHVGGSVRDNMMGKTPHDYDFTVTGLSGKQLQDKYGPGLMLHEKRVHALKEAGL